MKVFIHNICILILYAFPCFLVAYSLVTKAQESNKIYLRDYTVAPKYQNKTRSLQKNVYDIIYETSKFQLFLTDENNRNSAFIQNYERLTVDLFEDYVEVTLSDKMVVKRRYETAHPILDMRLALYELFYGKDYVEKNKEELIKKSLERMKAIDRLITKQESIAARKNKKQPAVKAGSNASIANPTPPALKKPKPKVKPKLVPPPNAKRPSKPFKKGDESSPPNEADGSLTDVRKKPAEPTVKEPEKKVPPEKKSEKKEPVDESSQEKAVSESDSDSSAEKPKPRPTPSPAKNSKPTKKAEVPDKPFYQKPVKGVERAKNNFKLRIFKPGESLTRTSFSLGYTYLQGENDEIIDTNTNLNFLNVGMRITRMLKKKGEGSFWENLDYDGRVFISKNTTSDAGKYDVGLGRRLEGYFGNPILDDHFGFGGTLSFENIQVGGIKDIGQGLTLVNINSFFIGPEIKAQIELFRLEVTMFAGYGYQFFHNSNIKTATFVVDKLYGDLAIYHANQWGYGIRVDHYNGIGDRERLGKSRFKIFQFTGKILYRF